MLKLFLFDAAGNLAIFALIWYWLGIPVAKTWQLAWIGVLALLIVSAVAYLLAVAFTREIKGAVRQTPRYLIWMGVLGLCGVVLLWLRAQREDVGLWIGSWLTYQLRVPVAPESATRTFEWIIALAGAAVLFLWLLPIAARGDWRYRVRPLLAPRYLLLVAGYFLIGLYLPWRLFWWAPEITSYAGQLTSAALRWTLAFAIYVWCWLEFARRSREQLSSVVTQSE